MTATGTGLHHLRKSICFRAKHSDYRQHNDNPQDSPFSKEIGSYKHCSMAVKTDMSKAYDRLEWKFIEVVLQRLGFHEKFCGWVMSCITTFTNSVLFNGEVQGMIYPTRGIRQGDPLSPYIFILCSEVLSGLCT